MKIIKRNGAEEVFDIKKIVIAVTKADSSSEGRSLTDSQIEDIAEFVEFKCNKLNRAVSVEEIQDLVEEKLIADRYRTSRRSAQCIGSTEKSRKESHIRQLLRFGHGTDSRNGKL